MRPSPGEHLLSASGQSHGKPGLAAFERKSSATPQLPHLLQQNVPRAPQDTDTGFSRTSGAMRGAGSCPAAPAAHLDLLDFITCTGAPRSTAPGCCLGIVGGPGPLSSCQSDGAKALTHLPLRNGAGMVGSLKVTAGPHPLCPATDPRNVSWDNDSPVESDCPPDSCALLLAKYYFWHHCQPVNPKL